MNNKHSNITPYIDELARVRAQLKELTEREEEIKKILKPLGPGRHRGAEHTLTISEQERDVLDMKAVREMLSEQFIKSHTTTMKYLVLRTATQALRVDKAEDEEEAA
jgi:hypothetical protein